MWNEKNGIKWTSIPLLKTGRLGIPSILLLSREIIYALLWGLLERRNQRGWSSSAPWALLSEISELPGMGQSNNSGIMQLPFQ